MQDHTYRDTFTHNSILATNTAHAVYGTVPDADGTGNVSDHNSFRAAGGSRASAQIGWLRPTYTGFATYQNATGPDRPTTYRGRDRET